MPDILAAYEIAPAAALPWLAAVLILAELAGGLWLLTRPRSCTLTPVWIYTGVAGSCCCCVPPAGPGHDRQQPRRPAERSGAAEPALPPRPAQCRTQPDPWLLHNQERYRRSSSDVASQPLSW